MTPREQFAALVETMLAKGDTTYGNDSDKGAKRMFGSTSIKTNKKMFAFINKDRLVVKLPEKRVSELVGNGAGEKYDPGDGRLMREWFVVGSSAADDWLELATEAEAFVGRK